MTQAPAPQRGKLDREARRVYVRSLVVLVSAIAGVFGVLFAVETFIEPRIDPELLLVPREVSREDNGYWLIVKPSRRARAYAHTDAIETILVAEGLTRGSSEWRDLSIQVKGDYYVWDFDSPLNGAPQRAVGSDQQVRKQLRENAVRWKRVVACGDAVLETSVESLQSLDGALAKPDFVIPLVSEDSHTSSLPRPEELGSWDTIARWIRYSATRHFNAGEVDFAIGDCRRLIQFGRRIRRSQCGVGGYFRGANIEELGAEHLVLIACVADLPPDRLRDLAHVLAPPDDLVSVLAEAIRATYTRLISPWKKPDWRNLEKWYEGRPSFAWRIFYSPRRTYRRCAKPLRALLEVIDKPGDPPPKAWTPESDRLADLLNPAGSRMIKSTGPACASIRDRVWEAVLTARFRVSLLAVKAHLIEHGKLPATLDELVPHYLDELPTDPWDDKPLRFSLATRAIYAERGGPPVARPDPDSEGAFESGPLLLWIEDYIPNVPK